MGMLCGACGVVAWRCGLHVRFPVFFFKDPATTEIYTLSLHDALPISGGDRPGRGPHDPGRGDDRELGGQLLPVRAAAHRPRSEEHTSELQSRGHLVCRLLLEKKKQNARTNSAHTSS